MEVGRNEASDGKSGFVESGALSYEEEVSVCCRLRVGNHPERLDLEEIKEEE
jgi:hypothetical protein